MTGFWARPVPDRPVLLTGVPAAAVRSWLDPLPTDAPALVTGLLPPDVPAAQVGPRLLAALEAAALDRFPAWLPEAAALPTAGGAAPAAVRRMAREQAVATGQPGWFVADLAERALRHRSGAPSGGRGAPSRGRSRRGRAPAAVRAAGLAQLLATAEARAAAALLVDVPAPVPASVAHAVRAAVAELAHTPRLAVWLAGPGVPDGIAGEIVPLHGPVPADHTAPGGRAVGRAAPAVPAPVPVGMPHHASAAEHRLEQALARESWARGREWNRTYQPELLLPQIRVDLMWPAERVAVEIDGPEHDRPARRAADRLRDARLRADGFDLLRFRNDQVARDLAAVLARIETLLAQRRTNGKDQP